MARNRHTPLRKRKKEGRSIRSPFHILGDKIGWSSWKDDHLPNVLWACGLTALLSRDEYLDVFRQVALRGRSKWKDQKHISLTHAALSTVEYSEFEYVFAPVSNHQSLLPLIDALSLIDALPDVAHWRKLFGDSTPSDDSLNVLAAGVAHCLDHQSEQSTDIRWLKLIYLAICGRLVLPEEKAEQLRLFPQLGDMRFVRPMIRAAEMSVRMMESGPEKPSEIPDFPVDLFWTELLKKTECIPAQSKGFHIGGQKELLEELYEFASEITDHFMRNITTTAVDPKMDGSFGIVIYAFHLCIELAALPSNQLSSGRIVLRTIVEGYLTLHYLSKIDNVTLWAQYRNYGSGQSALSYLKTVDLADAPSYITLDELENLANEDAWFETKDISIGNWASKNLRQMATESGKKDLYDKYYDLLSSFSHSQWSAVRETCYTLCLNPLHRLHRLPIVGRPRPSVLPDACKILNLMLEDLNHLYPTFKRRIKWRDGKQKP